VTDLTKLLLVDDEREFVAALTQRLTRRNYSVTFAHSGKDALARLAQDNEIQVVILDVKMPGLNGIETLKLIRKNWPLVEVIMLTGHSTLDSAVNAIQIGANDYLLKPIKLEKLVAKIEEAADRKRHRDQLILEVRMKPYISPREREEQIAKILERETR
jgi:DNA-binding NtrC family response regulator